MWIEMGESEEWRTYAWLEWAWECEWEKIMVGFYGRVRRVWGTEAMELRALFWECWIGEFDEMDFVVGQVAGGLVVFGGKCELGWLREVGWLGKMGWIGRYRVSIGEYSAGWIEVKVNIGITVGQYSDG